jgi:hypothetical protein
MVSVLALTIAGGRGYEIRPPLYGDKTALWSQQSI